MMSPDPPLRAIAPSLPHTRQPVLVYERRTILGQFRWNRAFELALAADVVMQLVETYDRHRADRVVRKAVAAARTIVRTGVRTDLSAIDTQIAETITGTITADRRLDYALAAAKAMLRPTINLGEVIAYARIYLDGSSQGSSTHPGRTDNWVNARVRQYTNGAMQIPGFAYGEMPPDLAD